MAEIRFRNCTNIEAEFVIDKLVEYNLSQVPSQQKNDFIFINKIAEKEDGKNNWRYTEQNLLLEMYVYRYIMD